MNASPRQSSIIAERLAVLLGAASRIDREAYSLRVAELSRAAAFPFGTRPRYAVVLELHGSTLEFEAYVSDARSLLPLNDRKSAARCEWFICSDRGGIYLHEAIDTKRHRSYSKWHSRFTVLNTGDGTVTLSPGHAKNRGLTDELKEILATVYQQPWDIAVKRLDKALAKVVAR
jgi:hypothetical protein